MSHIGISAKGRAYITPGVEWVYRSSGGVQASDAPRTSARRPSSGTRSPHRGARGALAYGRRHNPNGTLSECKFLMVSKRRYGASSADRNDYSLTEISFRVLYHGESRLRPPSSDTALESGMVDITANGELGVQPRLDYWHVLGTPSTIHNEAEISVRVIRF
jgi:hypothetical protein